MLSNRNDKGTGLKIMSSNPNEVYIFLVETASSCNLALDNWQFGIYIVP